MIKGTVYLLDHATDYYRALVCPREGDKLSLIPIFLGWGGKTICPIKDVKFSLDMMVTDKAPRHDGIHVEFYTLLAYY
jgi:hypothetical protein